MRPEPVRELDAYEELMADLDRAARRPSRPDHAERLRSERRRRAARSILRGMDALLAAS